MINYQISIKVKLIANAWDDQAVLKFFNQPDKHVLVATSKDEDLLVRAGRYLANYELMTQTDKEETTVDENTDTFSSTLEFDGNYPLTSTGIS